MTIVGLLTCLPLACVALSAVLVHPMFSVSVNRTREDWDDVPLPLLQLATTISTLAAILGALAIRCVSCA